MNVLLLGSGGREHAFAWKISQSPKLEKLYIAPGNTGTAQLGTNVALDICNFASIKEFCLQNHIQMVVVGPEAPLVEGIYDYFKSEKELGSIQIIAPSKKGAALEGSKDIAKEFMIRHQIPTARHKTITQENLNEGLAFLATLKAPYVLKADGLASGKGVVILEDLSDAQSELSEMILNRKFGSASQKVVIEEYLHGIELSVFVITDGENYKILPTAKDYKRIGEGDTGLNTGGMGAISQVPFANAEFMKKVEERIVLPTINGLKSEAIPYKGFVFIGLMNVDGNPFVIEYNVRMGDPETEAVLPLIDSDLIELFEAVSNNQLQNCELRIRNSYAATVILVSKGYPENFEKGKKITGLKNIKDSIVFHAGTNFDKEGNTVSSGGRVIAITSLGNTIEEALEKTYKNAEIIDFEGKVYRKDIGQDLL